MERESITANSYAEEMLADTLFRAILDQARPGGRLRCRWGGGGQGTSTLDVTGVIDVVALARAALTAAPPPPGTLDDATVDRLVERIGRLVEVNAPPEYLREVVRCA